MGRFSGVLLASDYDDTLYNRSGRISPRNRAALQHFVEEGGLFTISTGRSYINFAIQMERERLPVNVPVVLSNGAAIYDFQRGRLLWQSPLPKEAAGHLQLLCAAYPQLGFEAYYENEVYTFRANGVTRHHLKRCCLEGLPREIQEMPGPWVKVILQHEDPAYLNQVQEELCLVQPVPAGGDRQGRQQRQRRGMGGPGTGHPGRRCVLRGEWAQRYLHAGGVRGALRAVGLLPGAEGLGGGAAAALR